MPIHPDNRHRYPPDWPEISARIRTERAGNRCECRGQCGHDHVAEAGPTSGERCTARNREPHPVTTSTVVLTVAHLDHQPEHSDDANLLAMCQRCHLAYDRDHHAESRARRLASRSEIHRTMSDAPSSIIAGDCREILPTIPTGSVDLAVTSPPYLEQRVYGDDPNEIGHEPTVALYVATIADVFDELARILRPDGSAWLNIGDKANGSGGSGGDWKPGGTVKGQARKVRAFRDRAYPVGSYLDVPGQVVAELLRRGWRLRLPIVWHKGQEAPEDLRHVRRPRWSHEMIYLLAPPGSARIRFYPSGLVETGSVWTFPAGGSGDRHLAPFPDELARRAILAGSLPGDLVLDPFSGSGTVPRVAAELGRRGIGIELYHDHDPKETTP